MRPAEKLCTHVYEDGRTCQAYRLHGRDVCLTHSRTAEERSEAARRAGSAKGRARLPFDYETVSWFVGLLVSLINGSRSGRDIVEYIAPVCAASPGQRAELEELLSDVAKFERAAPTKADHLDSLRRYLRHGIEHGYVNIEEQHLDVQALAR